MQAGGDMATSDKVLERYVMLRRLARQGVGGEKDNAQRIMQRMRNEHPNIDREADVWERAMGQDSGTQQPPPEPEDNRPHWGDLYQRQQRERQEAQWKQRFTQWGQAASSAFSWAADVASQAFAANEARILATENTYTNIQIRRNTSGSMTFNVRLTPETLSYLQGLSEEQQSVYANTVAQRLANDIFNNI